MLLLPPPCLYMISHALLRKAHDTELTEAGVKSKHRTELENCAPNSIAVGNCLLSPVAASDQHRPQRHLHSRMQQTQDHRSVCVAAVGAGGNELIYAID